MSPITHFMLSWLVAEAGGFERRRDRVLVTLAGIVPDADGLGAVVEIATRHSEQPLLWWSTYHHVVGHNLLVGLLVAGVLGIVSQHRLRAAVLGGIGFHLHLAGDLAGARGPDGAQWPIHYLWPFSPDKGLWLWSGQWELNAWPNVAITLAALGVIFVLARRRGYSPLEMISRRADRAFVDALNRRFPPSR